MGVEQKVIHNLKVCVNFDGLFDLLIFFPGMTGTTFLKGPLSQQFGRGIS